MERRTHHWVAGFTGGHAGPRAVRQHAQHFEANFQISPIHVTWSVRPRQVATLSWTRRCPRTPPFQAVRSIRVISSILPSVIQLCSLCFGDEDHRRGCWVESCECRGVPSHAHSKRGVPLARKSSPAKNVHIKSVSRCVKAQPKALGSLKWKFRAVCSWARYCCVRIFS